MDKPDKVFHIAFWSENHPPEAGSIPPHWLSALKITIELDAIPPEYGPEAERVNIALAEHPLYKHLQQYVLANKR